MNRTARRCTGSSVEGMESGTRFQLKSLFAATSLVFSLGVTTDATAGETIKIGQDASLTIGVGARISYTSTEDGAPSGTSNSNEFEVENARIFLNGTWGKYIKGTLNTEKQGGAVNNGGDSIRVMDAIAQFELNDVFNFWLGRMLPPSDRANLYGPFYVTAWAYPGVVSNYPNIAVGRDDGAMIWGKPFGGKLVYSVGAFNGHNRVSGLSNESDNLLFAGRLHFNFLDVEPPPAHYLGGTYFGAKDIFSIGLAGNVQSDGVGTAAKPGDLKIWSIDGLFEKKLGGGWVPTLEGAYYKYNLDGAVDCNSGEPGSTACPSGDNTGGQVDGKAYMVSAALLFPTKVGWGQFQPFVRYQKFDRDVSDTRKKATEFGVNYIINGSNAKLSAVYTKFDDDRVAASSKQEWNQFVLGVQLQF